jgi:hypothetical protein
MWYFYEETNSSENTTHPKANTGEYLTSFDGEISLLSDLKGVSPKSRVTLAA